MSCCSLREWEGIPWSQFCDTLARRLEVNLEQALVHAKEMLQSSSTLTLAEILKSGSYFAKLTGFGRLITQPLAAYGGFATGF